MSTILLRIVSEFSFQFNLYGEADIPVIYLSRVIVSFSHQLILTAEVRVSGGRLHRPLIRYPPQWWLVRWPQTSKVQA